MPTPAKRRAAGSAAAATRRATAPAAKSRGRTLARAASTTAAGEGKVALAKELAEAGEQLAATSDILRVIARSPNDVQPVFDTIVMAALKLCEATASNVVTFDGRLIHVAAVAPKDEHGDGALRRHFDTYPRPPSRDTANTRAILTCTVVTIPDVLEDPDYAAGATAIAAGYRSVLSVPLMRHESPIGVPSLSRGAIRGPGRPRRSPCCRPSPNRR